MSNMVEEQANPSTNWWVYMVRCADGSLYTGVTTSIERRIRQHNGDIRGGARYTASRRPVVLAGACKATDRSNAQKLEASLKRLMRSEKLAWCSQNGSRS
jgi:putative endonuclease